MPLGYFSESNDPVLGALVELYRAFFDIYLVGWSQEMANILHAAASRLVSLPDLRIQCRVAWMEGTVLAYSGQYAAACRKAEESRQYSRKAGKFFDYFSATHVHRGDLGSAIRVAKDDAALAAKNGSQLPLLWLHLMQGWACMETFEYERALLLGRDAKKASAAPESQAYA